MTTKGDVPKKGDKYTVEVKRNKDNTKVRYIFTKRGYASYEYSRIFRTSGSGKTTFQKNQANRTNKNSKVPKIGRKYNYSWTSESKSKNCKIVKYKYWKETDKSKHPEFILKYTFTLTDWKCGSWQKAGANALAFCYKKKG